MTNKKRMARWPWVASWPLERVSTSGFLLAALPLYQTVRWEMMISLGGKTCARPTSTSSIASGKSVYAWLNVLPPPMACQYFLLQVGPPKRPISNMQCLKPLVFLTPVICLLGLLDCLLALLCSVCLLCLRKRRDALGKVKCCEVHNTCMQKKPIKQLFEELPS